MAENSKIEWTDHTINFWWGCLKVSPGCTNCYAETFSKRVGRNIWGPPQTTERWRTKGPWADCLKWDQKAKAEGVRRKVFCQSMSDFFEDHPQLPAWRKEAFEIIESFEWLDVQLLTKRIENVLEMVPQSWLNNWPAHVWMGTSVENQEYADKRIPELLRIPARIRFLSMEPLLGPVCLDAPQDNWLAEFTDEEMRSSNPIKPPQIHWVIVGGESGHHARPMHPAWVRSLRDQCQGAGVAFFFKQWGEYLPVFNSYTTPDGYDFVKMGKKAAGRDLDGRTWDCFPTLERVTA